jgi:hypothetical protein
MKKQTKAEKAGIAFADAMMWAAHLSYNARRGQKMIEACIIRLHERKSELRPQKATPSYRKARYSKKPVPRPRKSN